MPLLSAGGELDEIIPVENVALLADRPGARSARFPVCGHGFAAQRPREVADLIDTFCRSV